MGTVSGGSQISKMAFPVGIWVKTLIVAFLGLNLVAVLRGQWSAVVDLPSLDRQAGSHLTFKHRDPLLDVQNQTLGTAKIYVISIPDRVDKRDLWSLASLHSDIQVEYSDGVDARRMADKAIPVGWDTREPPQALGCFRGHADVWQKMLDGRVQSAVVFEDDADWDLNIKSQLVEVARGARYIQGHTGQAAFSPYGDDWDLIWLGHCGVVNRNDQDARHYVIHGDPTAAHPERLRKDHARVPYRHPDVLQGNDTRLLFEPHHGLCATAYMLSLRGAQKLLYNFSVKERDATPLLDRALSLLCRDRLNGAKCITTYPALVGNYRAPGNTTGDSDINHRAGSVRARGETDGIVYPVKTNLGRLVDGQTVFPPQWDQGHDKYPTIDRDIFQYPVGREILVSQSEWKSS